MSDSKPKVRTLDVLLSLATVDAETGHLIFQADFTARECEMVAKHVAEGAILDGYDRGLAEIRPVAVRKGRKLARGAAFANVPTDADEAIAWARRRSEARRQK